jgi:hypothetical protein
MDAFYASVEVIIKIIINKFFIIQMRDNPALQHVPMAVGGDDMLVILFIFKNH